MEVIFNNMRFISSILVATSIMCSIGLVFILSEVVKNARDSDPWPQGEE